MEVRKVTQTQNPKLKTYTLAGLYLHIPFCKQACHYCNFHFSTSLKQKDQMVEAILKEIQLQKGYLNGAALSTIYLGGGTPSLLSQKDLARIFNTIHKYYAISSTPEITVEANPDDLSEEKLQQLKASPINRLSIGVQSFFEEDLQWMNRAHSALEAKNCIDLAQSKGFNNITIDLIYGTPTTTNLMWEQNIQTAINLNIPHISCYSLTVEPNTALAHFVKKGTKANIDEQQSAEQLEFLMERLESNGYEQYEISNFAKPDCHARHNSNYWLGTPYLGIGPSAHSYNGKSRQWNIAHNSKYIQSISTGKVPFEEEILTTTQKYNEYVLTTLRTKWGSEISNIQDLGNQYAEHFTTIIVPFCKDGLVVREANTFRLSRKGRLLADRISMELFFEA